MQNSKKKLLFVDDERNILDMLGHLPAQCGVLTESVNFVHKLFAIEGPLTKVRAALTNETGRSHE